jgi:hypothetical protein
MKKNEVQTLQEIKAQRKPLKRARTLLLDDDIFSAISAWCEDQNKKTKAQNAEMMKKPPAQRGAKKPLIKPCDVIDRLLKKLRDKEIEL